MEYMLMPLKRYAEFSGRSRRKEYWMFVLGTVIVYFVLGFLLGGGDEPSGLALGLLGIFYLAILIPSIAVGVRRLHDVDKSGWFLLIGLIPLVGGFIILYFTVQEGTRGPNRFGPDPKGPDSEHLEETFS